MAKQWLVVLVAALVSPACGRAPAPGSTTGSPTNPWLELLNRRVEIDGVALPLQYDFAVESRRWDWANSFQDYMAEKADAVFLPGSPAMLNQRTATESIATIKSVLELHQAIIWDRPHCPSCGQRHKRVKRDLLFETATVLSLGGGDGVYEGHPPSAVAQQPPSRDAELAVEVSKILSSIRTGKLAEKDLIDSLNRADELGRLDDAVFGLEKLTSESPKDADLQVTFAIACIVRGQKAASQSEVRVWAKKANDACMLALKADPDHWLGQMWRAMVLMDFGSPEDLDTAIGLLERLASKQESIASEPRHARTYRYLGRAHSLAGNRAKAREYLEQGLTRFPSDAGVRDELDALGPR